jgi:hypothetical protein
MRTFVVNGYMKPAHADTNRQEQASGLALLPATPCNARHALGGTWKERGVALPWAVSATPLIDGYTNPCGTMCQ